MLHIKDNRASDGGTVKHAIKKNISLTFFWLELTVCIISHREWSWTAGPSIYEDDQAELWLCLLFVSASYLLNLCICSVQWLPCNHGIKLSSHKMHRKAIAC